MGTSFILLATFVGVTFGKPTVSYGSGQPIVQPVYLNLDENRLPVQNNLQEQTNVVFSQEGNLGFSPSASQIHGLYHAPNLATNMAPEVPSQNIPSPQNVNSNQNDNSFVTDGGEACESNCLIATYLVPPSQNSVFTQQNNQEVSSQNAHFPEYSTSRDTGGSSQSATNAMNENVAENVVTEQINNNPHYNIPEQNQVYPPAVDAQNSLASMYGVPGSIGSGISGPGQANRGFANNNAYGNEVRQNVKQQDFSKSNSETGFSRTYANGQTESVFKSMSSHQFSSYYSYTQ